MCIFTGQLSREQPVQVEATRIFTRFVEPGRQCIVYSMTVRSTIEVAMVLPVPIEPRAGEQALRFVPLDRYRGFFTALEQAFPPRQRQPRADGAIAVSAEAAPPLEVHRVGDFEASFVPTVDEFDRLDARFRIPAQLWPALSGYRTWGFAVFKLRDVDATGSRIHPMAFTFPTRTSQRLYFPTTHVHDGKVRRWARFDHALYFQAGPSDGDVAASAGRARTSEQAAGAYMDADRAAGLVDGGAPVHLQRWRGLHRNGDIWTDGAMRPRPAR